MMKISIGLIIFFLVFFLFPAILFYFIVFKRKEKKGLVTLDLEKIDNLEQKEKLKQARDFFFSKEKEVRVITSLHDDKLIGYYYDNNSQSTAILMHGYRDYPLNINAFAAYLFYKQGYNVLLPIERGHYPSQGKYTTLGIEEQYDLLNWITDEENREIKDIVLYGLSFGASTIAYAADKLADTKVRKIILDAAYISPLKQIENDMIKFHIPLWPILLIINKCAKIVNKLDMSLTTIDSLKKTNKPVLYLHCRDDKTVPFAQGMEVYKSISSAKELIAVDSGSHVEALFSSQEVVEKFNSFIKLKGKVKEYE